MRKGIVLVVLGIGFAGLGLAQRGGRGGGGGGDMGGGMPMMSAPNKMDILATTLNLTKDQKKSVKAILDDGCKEAQPLRDQYSKSRMAIAEAVQNKKSDDDIKSAVNASAELAAQISEAEFKAFAKIIGSLDEAQKANRQSLNAAFSMVNGSFRNKNWTEE